MVSEIEVSILCVTYNHSRYISKAIDSLLTQEVDFRIEIIIADDCSSDGTRDIIKDYHEKYSDKIFPIFRDRNIGCVNNFKDAFSKARGKYISICEGDDYFIDKHKIKIQRDFMERHKGCTLCFHDVKFHFEDGIKKDYVFPRESFKKLKLNYEHLLERNFIQTNSAFYRRSDEAIRKISEINENCLPLDWLFHLIFAQDGKIRYIEKCMSVYRINPGGCWYGLYDNQNKHLVDNFSKIFFCYQDMLKFLVKSKECRPIVINNIKRLILSLSSLSDEVIKSAVGNGNIAIQINHFLISFFLNRDERESPYLLVPKKDYGIRHRLINLINRVCGFSKDVYKKH